MDQTFFVALGSNVEGDIPIRLGWLHFAIERINEMSLGVVAVSSFYQTPAYPPGSGPDFVNSALVMRGDGAPEQILKLLHDIEAEAGRTRDVRWGQRVLDLDLIAAGNAILPNKATYLNWLNLPLKQQMTEAPSELVLPHPRLQDRAFVLVPLAEIAPDWGHPVLGKTIKELCNELDRVDLEAIVTLIPMSEETEGR